MAIHKAAQSEDIVKSGTWYISLAGGENLCNRKMSGDAHAKWKHVTCKNCLKSKPKSDN